MEFPPADDMYKTISLFEDRTIGNSEECEKSCRLNGEGVGYDSKCKKMGRKSVYLFLSFCFASFVLLYAFPTLVQDQLPTTLSSLPAFVQLSETWEQNKDFPSKCNQMEVDVEYIDEKSGFFKQFDHIPTPELCCSLCQGEYKCNSFVWIKDAKLDGCPSQCWLKGGSEIEVVKTARVGFVSGTPPPRGQSIAVNSKKSPFLCFSLAASEGEFDLLRYQNSKQVGIFACEKANIYSNKRTEVDTNIYTRVVDSDLHCEYGGDSQSALNAWIFIAVWRKVVEEKEYLQYPWIVKADPDTVFFPSRLENVVNTHSSAMYINNCKYGLHGPLEVFSKGAISALDADFMQSWDGKSPKKCVEEQVFGVWGEDMFIDQCLSKVLNLKNGNNIPLVENLLCESHCDCPDWYWCGKGGGKENFVSFHPFKTFESYENCMANAIGG